MLCVKAECTELVIVAYGSIKVGSVWAHGVLYSILSTVVVRGRFGLLVIKVLSALHFDDG